MKVTSNYFTVKGKKYSLQTGIAIGDRRKNPERIVGFQINYKRHHIHVYKAEAMGGWDHLYYYVMRVRDKYMPIDGFTSGEESLIETVEWLKKAIDENTIGRKHWQDYE